MTQAKVLLRHQPGGTGESHKIPVRVVDAHARLPKLPPAVYDSDALQLRPTCSVPISVLRHATAYASMAPCISRTPDSSMGSQVACISRTPDSSTGSQVAKATCYSILGTRISSSTVPGPNYLRFQTVPEKIHLLVKRPERQAGQSYSSTATINLLISSSLTVPGPNHLRLRTVPEKMHLLVKRPERQAGQSHSSTATINLLYAFKRHDAVTDIS